MAVWLRFSRTALHHGPVKEYVIATPTSIGAWSYSALFGADLVDSLLSGKQWLSHTLAFSFPDFDSYWSTSSATGYGPSSGDGEAWSSSFKPLFASDQVAVRDALQAWSAVAKLNFNEVVDHQTVVGDLRFAYSSTLDTDDAQAWTYWPGQTTKAGDVWFNTTGTSYSDPWTPGSYRFQTVLHEIGHALGLKHPFKSNANVSVVLDPAFDSRSFTLMSYSADPGDRDTDFSYEPTTPMVLDIAAIQHLYGANTSHNTGNTNYVFSGTGNYHQTIWDVGGTDTIVYQSATGGEIDLNEGVGGGSMLGNPVYVEDSWGSRMYAYYNVWIAYGTVIENAVGGSGADTLIGNGVANSLNGGAGNDTLDGGAGNDTLDGGTGNDSMVGGAGNDTYIVDTAGDKVVEAANAGTDTVRSSISCTLAANVENLVLTGSAKINGSGNALNNVLTGNGAANTLRGGAGNDTLFGGAGNDTLDGGAGNDSLDGGTGDDSMVGGAGNDTYVVNAAGDKVVEAANGGTDTVQSSITYTLGANVENLVLSGSAAINGTGNGLANHITGNSAANTLRGGTGNDNLVGGAGNDTLDGGAGNDSMAGGTGNDTYIVNAVGDKVVEAANAGTDTVQSSITYTLGANVEKLVLTGSAAINGSGNALNNVLTGNGAANTLRGGAGNDTLHGGAGNDVLIGGAGSDRLTGGAGKDIFHFDSKLGSDTLTDFHSVDDTFRFSQAGLRIGDGDTVVDGFAVRHASGGFSTATEVVVFTPNAASLTAAGASAVIGSASSSFAAGDTRLFVVDNGIDSGIFLFNSSAANTQVSASELTLIATFNGSSTAASDYVFSA